MRRNKVLGNPGGHHRPPVAAPTPQQGGGQGEQGGRLFTLLIQNLPYLSSPLRRGLCDVCPGPSPARHWGPGGALAKQSNRSNRDQSLRENECWGGQKRSDRSAPLMKVLGTKWRRLIGPGHHLAGFKERAASPPTRCGSAACSGSIYFNRGGVRGGGEQSTEEKRRQDKMPRPAAHQNS
jgi:hypothetical protein